MFAIFFSEAMDPFYKIITSFPTVVFSVLLILCFFYWCFAVLGLVDFDFLNIDIPDGDLELNAGDDVTHMNVLAGLLFKFGLNHVPMPIIISIMALLGWFICYYTVHFLYPLVPDGILEFLLGIPILFGVLYITALLTGLIIKPFRPMFKAANQEVEKEIVGQIAVVRTSRVDKNFGEATLEDGGAGLIVKVRSYKDEKFNRGDRVALLEYVKDEHVYRVISEAEFNN